MTTTPHQRKRQMDNEKGNYAQPDVTREWISLREMQEIVGLGSTKCYELAASGSIPGVIKIGRAIRVNKQDLDHWLREQSI